MDPTNAEFTRRNSILAAADKYQWELSEEEMPHSLKK